METKEKTGYAIRFFGVLPLVAIAFALAFALAGCSSGASSSSGSASSSVADSYASQDAGSAAAEESSAADDSDAGKASSSAGKTADKGMSEGNPAPESMLGDWEVFGFGIMGEDGEVQRHSLSGTFKTTNTDAALDVEDGSFSIHVTGTYQTYANGIALYTVDEQDMVIRSETMPEIFKFLLVMDNPDEPFFVISDSLDTGGKQIAFYIR